jgi:hypothetical protein
MDEQSQNDPLKSPMRSWRGLHDVRFLINTGFLGGKLWGGPYHPAEFVVGGAILAVGFVFVVLYGAAGNLSGSLISLVGFIALAIGSRFAVQKTLELDPSPRSRLRGWWRSKLGAETRAYYVHGKPWTPLYSTSERGFLEAAARTRTGAPAKGKKS